MCGDGERQGKALNVGEQQVQMRQACALCKALFGKPARSVDWTTGLWRNGSASDSRSEGWEFESLWPHFSWKLSAPLAAALLA